MRRPGSPAGLLFRLIIPATSVFVITVLALIAATLGDSRAPVAQWLDAHAGTLLVWEFSIIIGLVLLAMTVDRIQILKSLREQAADRPASSGPAESDSPLPGAAATDATDDEQEPQG